MASTFIRYYSDNSTSYSSFDVSDGDSKGGMGPRITQFSSHKDDCLLDGDNFCVVS